VDAVTAVAALGGAAVGGVWAFFRYRREAPDIPRANAVVDATLFEHSDDDYLSVEVRFQHDGGARLTIQRDEGFDSPKPTLAITGLAPDGTASGTLKPTLIAAVDVLANNSELDAGETAADRKIVRVGRRLPETIGYGVTLELVAGWNDNYWAWSTNVVVPVAGPRHAIGATSSGVARGRDTSPNPRSRRRKPRVTAKVGSTSAPGTPGGRPPSDRSRR
jgi:hypothetical protein